MKKYIIPVCVLVLCACDNKSGSRDRVDMPYVAENGVITVPDGSPILANVETQDRKSVV